MNNTELNDTDKKLHIIHQDYVVFVKRINSLISVFYFVTFIPPFQVGPH